MSTTNVGETIEEIKARHQKEATKSNRRLALAEGDIKGDVVVSLYPYPKQRPSLQGSSTHYLYRRNGNTQRYTLITN